jgi:integrase/recombinase XerD
MTTTFLHDSFAVGFPPPEASHVFRPQELNDEVRSGWNSPRRAPDRGARRDLGSCPGRLDREGARWWSALLRLAHARGESRAGAPPNRRVCRRCRALRRCRPREPYTLQGVRGHLPVRFGARLVHDWSPHASRSPRFLTRETAIPRSRRRLNCGSPARVVPLSSRRNVLRLELCRLSSHLSFLLRASVRQHRRALRIRATKAPGVRDPPRITHRIHGYAALHPGETPASPAQTALGGIGLWNLHVYDHAENARSNPKYARIRGRKMLYQYVRDPLTADESDRLSNACETPIERLVAWTLLDTGLRVSELCALTSKNVIWQQRQLRIKGKGNPHGKKTTVRVVPMSNRVRVHMEHHFALKKAFPVKTRRAQDIVKAVANRAGVTRNASPHVLRHTFARSPRRPYRRGSAYRRCRRSWATTPSGRRRSPSPSPTSTSRTSSSGSGENARRLSRKLDGVWPLSGPLLLDPRLPQAGASLPDRVEDGGMSAHPATPDPPLT